MLVIIKIIKNSNIVIVTILYSVIIIPFTHFEISSVFGNVSVIPTTL